MHRNSCSHVNICLLDQVNKDHITSSRKHGSCRPVGDVIFHRNYKFLKAVQDVDPRKMFAPWIYQIWQVTSYSFNFDREVFKFEIFDNIVQIGNGVVIGDGIV